jgi:hypothetical protein
LIDRLTSVSSVSVVSGTQGTQIEFSWMMHILLKASWKPQNTGSTKYSVGCGHDYSKGNNIDDEKKRIGGLTPVIKGCVMCDLYHLS